MEQNASLVDRFKLEAKAASRLEHPNSVRVLDFGHDAATGALFLAMEYIEGRDLLQVLEEDGPFSAERAVSVMCQILDVLGVAHSLGIVHRDLKPENIIVRPVEEDGVTRELVTVCDFGIAQFAPRRGGGGFEHENTGDDGVVAGTPAYMSPEQARAELQDARSDLYSAGVVLYQLLTLHLPFEADDAYELALKHCVEAPPPPSSFGMVNPQLEEVCLRALSKSKGARYQTAREMRVALTRALMATPVSMSSANALALANADTMPMHVAASSRHWGRPRPLLPQSTPPAPLESPNKKLAVLQAALNLPRQKGWLWSYTLGAAAAISVILMVQLYRNTAESSAKSRKLVDRSRSEHMVRPSSARAQGQDSHADSRAALENAGGNESMPAELPVALSAPAMPAGPTAATPANHRATASKPARADARETSTSAATAAPEGSTPHEGANSSTTTTLAATAPTGLPALQEQGDVGFAQLVEGLTAGGGDLTAAPSVGDAPSAPPTEASQPSPEQSVQAQSAQAQSAQAQPSHEAAAGSKARVAVAPPVAAPAKKPEDSAAASRKRTEVTLNEHVGVMQEQYASAELTRLPPPAAAVSRASLTPGHASLLPAVQEKPSESGLASASKAGAEGEPQLQAAGPAQKSGLEGASVIARAHVVINGIAAKSAVSKSSIRSALNLGAMSECYRTALRGGAVSGEVVTGSIELTTSTSGSVTGANLDAPGLPGELRRCVEQVARRGRVREADTGAAQASITLAFMPR